MKYIPSNYELKNELPLQAITQALAQNWINSLAYFCLLKKVHKNSKFYKYSIRKLADSVKCSPSTMSHHLKVLASKGFISISGDTLTLTGTNKLKKLFKSKLIPVKYSPNKSDQVALLRFIPIKRNMAYQVIGYNFGNKALKFLKQGKVSGMKTKTMQKLTTGKTLQSLESSRQSNFMLSNKSFGKLINRSQRTGKNLQKKLNDLKLIKSSKNIIKLDMQRLDIRGFNELALPAKCFLSNQGTTYMRLPNILAIVKRKVIVCDKKLDTRNKLRNHK